MPVRASVSATLVLMRDYGTLENLGKAAGLSAVVTILAVGRLSQGNMSLSAYVPLTFMAMVFVAGATTAWGAQAGMPGVFTGWATCRRGALVAVGLALVVVAMHKLGGDTVLRELLRQPRHQKILELTLPPTRGAQLALVLWAGGVQTVILVAAPMSLFARLTQNRWVAAGLCLALRAYVVHRQMGYAGITEGVPVFMLGALLSSAAGCFLFARYGLAPAMLYAAIAEMHLFLGR